MSEQHEREEANKALGFAMWSYLGLAIPLVGWILAAYSLSLASDLTDDEGIVGRKARKARLHSIISIVLSIVVIGAWIGLYAFALNVAQTEETKRVEAEKQQQIQSQINAASAQRAQEAQLDTCLADAQATYVKNWEDEAKSLGRKDGTLPFVNADRHEERLKDWKNDCYKRYD